MRPNTSKQQEHPYATPENEPQIQQTDLYENSQPDPQKEHEVKPYAWWHPTLDSQVTGKNDALPCSGANTQKYR